LTDAPEIDFEELNEQRNKELADKFE